MKRGRILSAVIQFVRENALFLALILGLLSAFIFLRTKGTELASTDEFDAWITSGQPVVVEFYGNA